MRYEQYISLIQRLEKRAVEKPGAYRFKVLLLTILGYAYFLGLILLVIFPIVGAIGLIFFLPGQAWKLVLYTAKLWWAIIPGLGLFFGFIGSALKSITAKVPEPDGIELKRDSAPELFAFVYNACRSLDARRPEKILVTDMFNAGVITLPRYGIFGRKVLLVLGLPLMRALSPEQLKGVIAHEIGHISGRHGVFAKWAYQMREAWGRLIDSQEAVDHKFGYLYKGFVDWFFPYFTAYSFVLMREHEKAADLDAAGLVGTKPLGESLILMETKEKALQDDFWLSIRDENVKNATPTTGVFGRMLGALALARNEQISDSLAKLLQVPTDFNDSHPALADRLRLMGYWSEGPLPELPAQHGPDSATVFLGKATDEMAEQFGVAWDEEMAREWAARHDELNRSYDRIRELQEKHAVDPLSLEELRELARLLNQRDGVAAAVPVMEEAVERFPNDAVAWYNFGLARLSQDDDDGLEHLDKAAEMDKSLRLDADQVAFEYLRSKGRIEEAKRYAGSIDEHAEMMKKAANERQRILPGDNWMVHDLPAEFIEKIPAKLAGLDEIVAVYAVRKVVEHMPEIPCHAIFIDVRPKGRLRNRDDADASTILSIVMKHLDDGLISYFAILAGQWAGTKYYLDKIEGAKVYERSKS